MSNFMKIHPVGTDLCHVEGRSDGQTHDETNIRFFAVLQTHLKSTK